MLAHSFSRHPPPFYGKEEEQEKYTPEIYPTVYFKEK
jgi:hypothetical protein